MRLNPKLILAFLFLTLCFVGSAQASVNQYTYPYDISQIEWQILNWVSAYRGTVTPGDPFTLERMEYDRKTFKVIIYLTGTPDISGEENLKKSVEGCTTLFKNRFPNFDATTDLIIYYKLLSGIGQEAVYKEYSNGDFSDRQSAPDK